MKQINMKTFIDEKIEEYAFAYTRVEPQSLLELSEKTYQQMDFPQMLTGRVEGRLLKLLVQISQPKLVVEVGTFTGYSALSMAEGLPEGGKLITCEINPKAQQIAQQAFDESLYGNKIEIRMGPALDTIREIEEEIDFSFIDADKEGYPDYYEEILIRTRPGGLILLDNMFFLGGVLNLKDNASKSIHKLNRIICNDRRVENVLLTVRDGVQLVRKISS